MPQSKHFCPSTFSWGYELEVGDVSRSAKIPNSLGAWEYAETDVINLKPPYQYVACDPLGKSPPVGGEINTIPTATWKAQCKAITKILSLPTFRNATVCSTSHNHIHVRVPGLRDNIAALKRLHRYIVANQEAALAACYPFHNCSEMSQIKGIRSYLKYDGGRRLPEYIANNVCKYAKCFEDVIRLHCCGKDGVSRGRPFRFAVNVYCMKHLDTIEFRWYRSSLNPREISSYFKFAELFLVAALNTGEPISQLLDQHNLQFPKFRFNLQECLGWQRTRWDKSRGKKVRTYVEVVPRKS